MALPALRLVRDGLQNVITGLGTSSDKGVASRFVTNQLSDGDLAEAYRSSWIARKIVDIIPEDMTREWRAWQADEGDITALEQEEKRLRVRAKVTEAMRWARLLGGAALVLGTDGDLSEPLEPDRLPRGGLRWVHVVDRTRLNTGTLEDNLEDPNYGSPRSYLVTSSTHMWTLHHSRVVRFIGAERPPHYAGTDFWGDSVLQSLWDALLSAATAGGVMSSLLHEAKVDVVEVPDLQTHLSTQAGEDLLKRRFNLAQLLKSMHHMLLLGGGETYHTKQVDFDHLPEVHRALLQEVAGAADIPVTRLMGQSPAGLNATGESDLRMYYDKVASLQNEVLAAALDRIDPVLHRSALGDTRPRGLHYVFNSLWQREPSEIAEINERNAKSFALDVQSGLFEDEVLRRARANQIVESGAYPGWEQIEAEVAAETSLVGDAAPRTLYVRRDVVNVDEIRAWALSQGFRTVVPDLHVTVAYSRTPVDWMQMGDYPGPRDGDLELGLGGPRLVEPLGDQGAVVLLFSSWELAYRHGRMRELGASWDWDDYQPHVTITYRPPPDLDLRAVEPYRGRIVLGPEIFEELDLSRAAPQGRPDEVSLGS